MKITLVRYDEAIHGYVDDCDYVITYDESSYDLAVELAYRLGYVGGIFTEGNREMFLCHA
jgi:hypothetical protein